MTSRPARGGWSRGNPLSYNSAPRTSGLARGSSLLAQGDIVTFRSLHLAFVPLAVVLIAGCGTQASSNGPSTTATVSTTALPKGQVAATVNGKPILMSTYHLLLDIDTKHYKEQKAYTKK